MGLIKGCQKGGAWDSLTIAEDLILKYHINGTDVKLSPGDINDILDDLQEDGELPLHEGEFEEEREQRDEIKELYSHSYDDMVKSDPEFKKISESEPINTLFTKYPSGSSLFPKGIKKTFMNHWFSFKAFGLTMDALFNMDSNGYLQGIGLNEGQAASIFETIEHYKNNKKQKANQGLALAKVIEETTLKGFARHEEGIAEMIASALRHQPYNEDVAKRMKRDKLTGEFRKGSGKARKKKKTKGKKKKTKMKKKKTKVKGKKTKVKGKKTKVRKYMGTTNSEIKI
jgi:hypothetical protein